MSDVLAYLIVVLIVTAFFAYPSHRFMSLAGYERKWRAYIPIWNYLVLGNLTGVPRILFFIPIVNSFILMMVGYKLADRTGVPGIVGALLGVPLINILGFNILALLAKTGDRLEQEDRLDRWAQITNPNA